jgi:hypothetical protein
MMIITVTINKTFVVINLKTPIYFSKSENCAAGL